MLHLITCHGRIMPRLRGALVVLIFGVAYVPNTLCIDLWCLHMSQTLIFVFIFIVCICPKHLLELIFVFAYVPNTNFCFDLWCLHMSQMHTVVLIFGVHECLRHTFLY